VPGMRMGKTDRLSRRPDWKIGVDRDNKNQIFIKNNWIRSLQKVEILEKIKKARSKNKDIVRVVKEIKRVKIKEL